MSDESLRSIIAEVSHALGGAAGRGAGCAGGGCRG
jgi:hypothetical protein